MNKNFMTTMILFAVIATLTTTLFETTKNLNASTYRKTGNTIYKLTGRAPAVKKWGK